MLQLLFMPCLPCSAGSSPSSVAPGASVCELYHRRGLEGRQTLGNFPPGRLCLLPSWGTALPFPPVRTVGSLSALWWKDSGFLFALNSLSRESASWVLTTSYFALKNHSLSSVSPWGLALAFMPGLKDTSMAFPRRPPHSARLRTHVLCLYFRLCTPFPALCSFIATFG